MKTDPVQLLRDRVLDPVLHVLPFLTAAYDGAELHPSHSAEVHRAVAHLRAAARALADLTAGLSVDSADDQAVMLLCYQCIGGAVLPCARCAGAGVEATGTETGSAA